MIALFSCMNFFKTMASRFDSSAERKLGCAVVDVFVRRFDFYVGIFRPFLFDGTHLHSGFDNHELQTYRLQLLTRVRPGIDSFQR